jgi:hypothetical protein
MNETEELHDENYIKQYWLYKQILVREWILSRRKNPYVSVLDVCTPPILTGQPHREKVTCRQGFNFL